MAVGRRVKSPLFAASAHGGLGTLAVSADYSVLDRERSLQRPVVGDMGEIVEAVSAIQAKALATWPD